MKLTIREYLTPDGKSLFRDWLDTLDVPVRARVQARVLRFEIGNLGDLKAVGGGVWEARLAFGPGYRSTSARPAARSSCFFCCEPSTPDITRRRGR